MGKPWEEISIEHKNERDPLMSNRMSPEFLKWCFWEVSLGNQVEKRDLFASFQDVEYRGSGGVSHQGQELLCACNGQAM